MSASIVGFGEVLWDCLPSGRLLGGAPLNVAYHAAKLGARVSVISAVGKDALGEAAISRIAATGVATEHIGRHRTLPTGTVEVRLSAEGQPTFTIAEPVAWDEIPLGAPALAAARDADAIVFGSLAARSAANRKALDELLRLPGHLTEPLTEPLTGHPTGPLKVFDVNLRPPFDDLDLVADLARRSDIVKMNDAELARLSGRRADASEGLDRLGPALDAVVGRLGPRTYCVTCGGLGAALWRDGEIHTAGAPRVTVADTVGAGDAFTAAITLGLLADDSADGIRAALADACALGAIVCSLPGAQPEYDAGALGLRRM